MLKSARFYRALACSIFWAALLYRHYKREAEYALRSYNFWASQELNEDNSQYNQLSIGSSTDRLFWFLHVSDIHISEHGKGHGRRNFEEFLSEVVPTINPLFVVATGDLTDAKEKVTFASGQRLREWQTYRELLIKYGYAERRDFWFDLRGNHDCFDVPGWDDENNRFRDFSVQGTSTYKHIFRQPYGNYGLISVDGCPDFGPSRPINFFGSLPTRKMDTLEDQIEEMDRESVRHLFMISHYPISTIHFQRASSGKSFATLSKKLTAYFSGHLHNFAGNLGEFIYARQKTGFLDLEVGDLKSNRMYRVFAVDHDVVSFADQPLGSFPVILVTNPKDARFLVPMHEDVRAASRSNHIRILAFSPHVVTSVRVSIDDGDFIDCSHSAADHPLWTAPWAPSRYSAGLHRLTVVASDVSGSTRSFKQQFSLDGTEAPIDTFGESMALADFQSMVRPIRVAFDQCLV